MPLETTASAATRGSSQTVPEDDQTHARRWWILAVLALAQVMVVLDSTIVNIALPTAQTDLGFSNADRQWVVTGYALAFGSLLLIGGRLADFFGRKWALLVGLTGFAIASAIGGASVNFAMLVTARAVQGAFGALLAPAVLALLTTTFTDPKERGKAFGIFGGIAGAGASIGLLLGGFLTEYASWRWTLYVNLAPRRRRLRRRHGLPAPARAVGRAGARRHLGHGQHHRRTCSPSSTASPTPTSTAGPPRSRSICLAVGAVLLVTFVLIEQRVSNPILPLRVVLDRNRGGAFLVMFLAGIGMFAVFLFLTYYMQAILRLLRGQVRAGLPAADRHDHRGRVPRQRGAGHQDQLADPDPDRHAAVGVRALPAHPHQHRRQLRLGRAAGHDHHGRRSRPGLRAGLQPRRPRRRTARLRRRLGGGERHAADRRFGRHLAVQHHRRHHGRHLPGRQPGTARSPAARSTC